MVTVPSTAVNSTAVVEKKVVMVKGRVDLLELCLFSLSIQVDSVDVCG